MAYLNPAWITDRHCKDIEKKFDISESLLLCDMAVNAIVQVHGVGVGSIPVDGSGYITSSALIEYARMWLYVEILSNYWGSAHGENDIYYEKLEFYRGELAKAESALTKDNILQNEPLEPSSFVPNVVIY